MQHGRRMAAPPLLEERLPPQRRSCEQMVHCALDECAVAVRADAGMRVAVRRERLPNGRMLVLPELQRRFYRLLARQLRLRPEQLHSRALVCAGARVWDAAGWRREQPPPASVLAEELCFRARLGGGVVSLEDEHPRDAHVALR